MILDKNNVPIIVEEQVIEEEQLNLERILSRLKQPIPSNFIELGQSKKYWGSTEGLDKPLCERYTFKHNDKSITLDFIQELSNKLELTPTDNFYVAEKLLERKKTEGGITIDNEEEIFIQKPLTVNNLASTLQRWLTEIEYLKVQIQELVAKKATSQQTITDLTTERNNLTNQTTASKTEITQLKKWKNHLKFNLVPLFWPEAFYTEDTPSAEVLVARIKELISERNEIENERENYQIKWSNLVEELEQKGEIIKGCLQRIKNLEKENEEQASNLTEKDNALDDLRQEKQKLKDKLKEWTDQFSGQTAKMVQEKISKLTIEKNNIQSQRDARPDIKLERWNNDYSKRPTLEEFQKLDQIIKDIIGRRGKLETIINPSVK